MSTFRVNKNVNYTVMSNHHLQDKRLSLKAKGLLSYMLSLPDDWDYSLKGLTVGCKDGLDSVRTAVLELEEHGYVRRQKVPQCQRADHRLRIIRFMNRLLRTILPFPARKAGHRTRPQPKARKAA